MKQIKGQEISDGNFGVFNSPKKPTKGQLILKGLFGFFNSLKKRTKTFCSISKGKN